MEILGLPVQGTMTNEELVEKYRELINRMQQPTVRHIYHVDYRLPLGNHRKWIGLLARWLGRRLLPDGMTLLLRGRSPKEGYKYGWGGNLSLSKAKRVGVYLIIRRD